MHHVPIRTYERKNGVNGSRKVYKPNWTDFVKNDVISSNKRCETEHYDKGDDSLDYDFFETTFDRIAKDAIVPPMPLDFVQNKSSNDSNLNISDSICTSNALFGVSVGIPNNPLESTTTTYMTRNKHKFKQKSRQIINNERNIGKISKRGVLQSKKTIKEEELNKNYIYKKPSKNFISNKNSTLRLNAESGLKKVSVLLEKCDEYISKKGKSNISKNSHNNDQTIRKNLDAKLLEKFNIKPSFVVLNRESIKQYKSFNISKRTIQQCLIKDDVLIDKKEEKDIKLSMHLNDTNIQESSSIIRGESVQINPTCSTPIGNLKTQSLHLLAFSPINNSQNHSEELITTNIHEAATQVCEKLKRSINFLTDDQKKELEEDDICLSLTQKYELTSEESKKNNHCPSIAEYTNRSPSLFDNTSIKQKLSEVFQKDDDVKKSTDLTMVEQEESLERNKTKESSINSNNSFFVKLQNSDRVTIRRKEYKIKDFHLTKIYEQNESYIFSLKEIMSHSNKDVDFKFEDCKNVTTKDVSIIANNNSKNNVVYLKPGKSWTRSLSILHNIQNNFNLDELAVGKGKKWRHSVKNILDMQEQGILQSCTKNTEDDKAQQLQCRTKGSIQFRDHVFAKDRRNSFATAIPNRLSKRISIRVVVDDKNVNKIQDTPFLKVYGITVNEKQSSSQIEERNSNIHCSDIKNVFSDTCSAKIARDVVLNRCCQKDYIPFIECFPEAYLKYCRKIGEGVYGEVFLYEKDKQNSVLKIIPIEGDQLVNGEPQKKFEEILSEIVIAKELHNLRFNKKYNTSAFVEVKNIRCIQGEYPPTLIDLWRIYDDKKTSDNDCPSMFGRNQLYIALELDHGGQDLEAFVFQSAIESHALFVQTALAMAVAEKSLEFEHRDLHWGNVLISRTEELYIHYRLDNKDIALPSNGVKVSIIDFTLSRMSYQGCCIFNDLALDPALFIAQGEYQFEIYRLMRDKIENNWQQFEPYTNVLWLHYILDKMVTAVRYKRKNLRAHKNAILKLNTLKDVILSYKSAFDFISNCKEIVSLLCNNAVSDTEL